VCDSLPSIQLQAFAVLLTIRHIGQIITILYRCPSASRLGIVLCAHVQTNRYLSKLPSHPKNAFQNRAQHSTSSGRIVLAVYAFATNLNSLI
jgi:hypothetical protein